MKPLIAVANRGDIERFVYLDDREVRHTFQRELRAEIERVIQSLEHAAQALRTYEQNVEANEQAVYVLSFLFRSLDSLAGSLRSLVGGSHALANHQLRLFGESLSMAILCYDQPRIGREYDSQRFSVHKAVDRLNQKKLRNRLGLNETVVELLHGITKSADDSSHSTVLVEALSTKTRDFDGLRLSREYDSHKKPIYEGLLKTQALCGEMLTGTIGQLAKRFQAGSTTQDRT